MRRAGWMLATSVAALALASAARAAAPLPPEDALRRAIEEQPEVRAALARAREAQAGARLTAMGPHEWTLSAEVARRRIADEGRFGEWETALERGLRLPGKAALDRDIGRLEAAEAGALADAARRSARAAILEDWFGCLRARERARIAADEAEAAARIGAAVTARQRLGDAATLDVALADAEAASSAAETAAARGAAVGAARLLAARLPEGSCELDDWDAPDAGAGAAATPSAPDPALQARELAAERARKAAERARLDRWPDPTLGVRYGSERDGEERIGGLSFSVPLGAPRRGAEAARALAAAEAVAADLDAERAARARARLELEVDRARALAAWQQLAQAAARQAEAARLSLRAWELGELPLSEALLQRRAALRARMAEREASLDAWRAAALHQAQHGDIATLPR